MASESILPPLNEKASIPQVDRPGEWVQGGSYALLGGIGLSLKNTHKPSIETMVSIPDTWAQAELYRAALSDEGHPVHATAVRAWRGLLALFALAPYFNYRLSTRAFRLSELVRNPFTAERGATASALAQSFASVLYGVRPSAVLCRDHNWESIGTILLNDVPVGMIVPSTIVCPGRGYAGRLPIDLPWIASGRLEDPTRDCDLQPEQFGSLALFARELRQVLGAIPAMDGMLDLYNGILREIDRFAADAAQQASERGFDLAGAEVAAFPTTHELPQQPLFAGLNRIVRVGVAAHARTDVLIRPREEFSETCSGFVLIDPNLPDKLSRPAAQIRVWNYISAETLQRSPERLPSIVNEMRQEGYVAVRPRDLFTDKLCQLNDRLVAAHEASLQDFVLPLSPLCLMIYRPKELTGAVRLRRSDNGYAVVLQLPLRTASGAMVTVTVERIYGADDVVKLDGPNALSMWPNFTRADWRWHFLYYQGLMSNLMLRAAFAAEPVAQALREMPVKSERVKRIENFASAPIDGADYVPLTQSEIVVELRRLSQPPEALLCDYAADSRGKFRPSSERSYAGLLLLTECPVASNYNTSWAIGVDFGTTNTSVYYAAGADEPQALLFANRHMSPFVSPDQEKAVSAHAETLPFRQVEVPFMTVLRDRRDAPRIGGEQIPVLNYVIADMIDVRAALDQIRDPSRGLKFNLKWSDEPEDRVRVQSYLSMIVLQSCAEAAAAGADLKGIRWHFSYPEAFRQDRVSAFRRSSVGAVRRVAGEPAPPAYRTESLAAALYFSNKRLASFAETVVTIDVGGQTSDISVWQDRKLLWRNSVELAGRHIMTEYLRTHRPLLGALAGENAAIQEAVKKLNQLNEASLTHGIEVIINSTEFRRNFANRMAILEGKEPGAGLRRLAEVALAGLISYIAKVLLYLTEAGKLRRVPRMSIKFCLGGRASTLFSALFAGDEELERVLGLFHQETNGLVETAEIVYSQEPKHEVAYGLLVAESGAQDLDTADRTTASVLGEQVRANDTTLSPNSTVDMLPVEGDWRIQDTPSLDKFFATLDSLLGLRVTLPAKSQAAIREKMNRELLERRVKPSEAANGEAVAKGDFTLVEPPFIIGVRAVIAELIAGRGTVTTRP